MWRDVRYGLRSITGQPGFTALAIVTLALGIGAATTIFSVIQNVLLDPFPYRDAHRVIAIRIHDATNPQPFGRPTLGTPESLDYVEQTRVIEEAIGGIPSDVLIWRTRSGVYPHATRLLWAPWRQECSSPRSWRATFRRGGP